MGPENLSTLLSAVYRRRLTVLLVLLGSVGAGYLYMARTPQVYVAQAKLFVPTETPRLSLQSESANLPAGPMVPTFDEQTRVGIMGLMNSGAVFGRIAERVPGINPTRLRKNLVGDVDGSQQMVISVYDTDPEFAAMLANEALTAFSDLMNEMAERHPRLTLEVLDQEIPGARADLAAAEAAKATFLTGLGIADLDAELDRLLTELSNAQQQLDTVELDEAGLPEQRGVLDEQLASRPELERRSLTLQRNEAYQAAINRITQLESQLAELRVKYQDAHPQVKAVLAQLGVQEDTARAEAEEEMLHASSQLGPDRVAESITQKLVDLQVSESVLAPKRATLEARIAAIEAELAELPEKRTRLGQLEQAIEERAGYLDRLTQRREELNLTLERGLEFTYMDPDRQATPEKAKPVPTMVGVILFCVIGGLIAGVALAIAMELVAVIRSRRPW